MRLLRETDTPADDSPESLTLFAMAMARTGQLDRAAGILEERCKATPAYAETIETHAEILDMVGESDRARDKYQTARRLRAEVRQRLPDRSFALRGRGSFLVETVSYSHAANVVKDRALPLMARGNAYLAEGKPQQALADYEQVLKVHPDTLQAVSLKGEAYSMMGHYKEAIAAFTTVLATWPRDTEALSGRAIALMAQGKVDAANADWRGQLELLAPMRVAARACVALRLADYERALPELKLALVKEPGDPYWKLYQQIARRRLRRNDGATAPTPGDKWPAPLFALLEGGISADEVFAEATTPGRRSEALFVQGVMAASRGHESEAATRWNEVVAVGPADLIEYAAARNELQRIRS